MKTTLYSLIFETSYSPPVWAAVLAGFFVILSLTLSAYLLFEHLSSYKNPERPKQYIAKASLPSHMRSWETKLQPIVNDVKFTVSQAVEPMEKGINRFNQKIQKISQNIKKKDRNKHAKDDCFIASLSPSPSQRLIQGIDDLLLIGSVSDSGVKRGKKHRDRPAHASTESGGESSSDQSLVGRYLSRCQRRVTKD